MMTKNNNDHYNNEQHAAEGTIRTEWALLVTCESRYISYSPSEHEVKHFIFKVLILIKQVLWSLNKQYHHNIYQMV